MWALSLRIWVLCQKHILAAYQSWGKLHDLKTENKVFNYILTLGQLSNQFRHHCETAPHRQLLHAKPAATRNLQTAAPVSPGCGSSIKQPQQVVVVWLLLQFDLAVFSIDKRLIWLKLVFRFHRHTCSIKQQNPPMALIKKGLDEML